MNKKYIALISITILILLIFIPILINGLMFNQGLIKVHGSNEDVWISSLASYFGAIIGGVVSGVLTLLGVQLTINKSSQDVRLTMVEQELQREDDIKRSAIKEQLVKLYHPLYAFHSRNSFKRGAFDFTDLNEEEKMYFIHILNENEIYALEDLYLSIIEFEFAYQANDFDQANEYYVVIIHLVNNSIEEMKEYLMLPNKRL